jgi:hypothetical protein
LKVPDCLLQAFNAVIEIAQSAIAAIAKPSAKFTSHVAVIQMTIKTVPEYAATIFAG